MLRNVPLEVLGSIINKICILTLITEYGGKTRPSLVPFIAIERLEQNTFQKM